eukprot:693256-Prorocentrum_minimum.AAC.7
MTKRPLRSHASRVPDGIPREDIPTYVSYMDEHYTNPSGTQGYREFFRIEGHPAAPKMWSTTKSNKVTLLWKLAHAYHKLFQLDQDVPDAQGSFTHREYVPTNVREILDSDEFRRFVKGEKSTENETVSSSDFKVTDDMLKAYPYVSYDKKGYFSIQFPGKARVNTTSSKKFTLEEKWAQLQELYAKRAEFQDKQYAKYSKNKM